MSVITELPRGSCSLGGANTVLTALHRVIPIYHSGPGCPLQTSAGEFGQAGGRSPASASAVSIPLSNMLEEEVVFGGIDRLRGTVEGALEIYDADAFFVLTGCTAGIIGDNVQELVKEFRAKGEQVYALDTPGFLGDNYRGYEIAFNGLLEQVIEEAPRQANLVNLYGIVPYHDPFWEGTFDEFVRIFERLGLEVNTFFTRKQGIETVRSSSAAALNIVLSPWLLKPFAYQFEKRFGTPTLRWQGIPLGATDTSALVRAVGEALNLDSALVERVVEEEERDVYRYLETIIGALSWKRFAVVGNAQSVIGISRFLANDYSFTPIAAVITDPIFRDEDFESITHAITDLEYAQPPVVIFESDQYNIQNELLKYPQITLLVGSSNDRYIADELEAQFLPAVFPLSDRLILTRTYFGYRGSLTFIEDLFDNL
jgi:nitrogenase molybdenum-iron protein beta chain